MKTKYREELNAKIRDLKQKIEHVEATMRIVKYKLNSSYPLTKRERKALLNEQRELAIQNAILRKEKKRLRKLRIDDRARQKRLKEQEMIHHIVKDIKF